MDFGEPGVFIRSLSLRMSLLITDDFCYFLCSCFKIVLQRERLLILKSLPGLGLFGKSGAGKETTTLLAFLAQFLAGGSQVCLVDGRTRAAGSF